MRGAYVFRVRFRADASDRVSLSPSSFETTLRYAAPEPGTDGWLFFRDTLWRGEVNDHEHARRIVEDELGVPVESVDFRSLRADREYVAALRDAVADDLEPFKADSVDDALSKYLGSSIDVVATD
ncbi:LWR-salt protein [Halorubellus sp. JP-L1]|uniref:LWR-salt protein n=1 Tax=Halorubellus sp. JP-L1 TaxID=2715753 RepID=UPI00140D1EFD|nr:LWR-salt protein [Halorubellus sp. JP-L1]NHN41329.1 LWR-salt protein [Halorubellus sp. JP-L1]